MWNKHLATGDATKRHQCRGHCRASTYYDQKILERENDMFYFTLGHCSEVPLGGISGKRPDIASVSVQWRANHPNITTNTRGPNQHGSHLPAKCPPWLGRILPSCHR